MIPISNNGLCGERKKQKDEFPFEISPPAIRVIEELVSATSSQLHLAGLARTPGTGPGYPSLRRQCSGYMNRLSAFRRLVSEACLLR
jgi:hypothetical protein